MIVIPKKTESKCSKCGENFNKELLTIRGNKKYCQNCLKIIDQNKEEWDLLFKYICEIYDIEKPTGFIFKQLKTFREDEKYNYTNIGMYYTLKYYCEIIEKEPQKEYGISMIPYYYDEAANYYNRLYDIADIADDFNNTEKEILINTKIQNKKLNQKKLISLEDIEVEADATNNKETN